jgi:hypothetical protein
VIELALYRLAARARIAAPTDRVGAWLPAYIDPRRGNGATDGRARGQRLVDSARREGQDQDRKDFRHATILSRVHCVRHAT